MWTVWLLHPHSLLDTKVVLSAFGRGEGAKVPGTEVSSWELIYNEFGGIFLISRHTPRKKYQTCSRPCT